MPTGRGPRVRFRLLGHPVHPMVVHLPMGLLLTAPLWDLLSVVRPAGVAVWSAIGAWTVGLGCLAGLAAAVAGLIDLGAVPAGHPAGRAANLHLYLMLGALALFGTGALVRHGHRAAGVFPAVLALDVGGFLALVAGGFFGAEMVYRYGVGRESTSESSGAGYHLKRT
jgi:uncharacterized membrane protein